MRPKNEGPAARTGATGPRIDVKTTPNQGGNLGAGYAPRTVSLTTHYWNKGSHSVERMLWAVLS